MNVTNESTPTQSTSPDRKRLRRIVYAVIIIIAAGLSFTMIQLTRPLLSANDRSRWCTVWSLVERGTYTIDEIAKVKGWDTIDKVRHDRHFYSSKPALLPTLVAGVYWSVNQTLGWNLLDDTHRVSHLILTLINLVPMIIALVVMAVILERYAVKDTTRYFVIVAAAFGTFLTTYLVTFNNHNPAAFSVLFAIYPAMRIVADGERRATLFICSGIFAAFACTNELPAALFGVAIFGLLFTKAPKQTLMFFVPAALIPLGGFFLTTWIQTGGWKPFYLYYGTEKYLYEGSYWLNPKGLDKGTDSTLVYLLHCTIGHHGILSLSPIFLLTLVGWAGLRNKNAFPPKSFAWMGLGLTLAILGFYLSRTANYNYGGNTSGLRWTFWLIPFWLIAMIPVLDRWGHRRWFQVIAVTLLLISIFSVYYPVSNRPMNNPWRPPWLYNLMEQQNWIDYSD